MGRNGFSMIEVLIVAAAAIIVAFGLSAVTKSQFETLKSAEHKGEAGLFLTHLKTNFLDSANCMNAFPATSFTSGAQEINTTAVTGLNSINLPGATYTVGTQLAPGLTILSIELEGPPPAGAGTESWRYLSTNAATSTVATYLNVDFENANGPAPRYRRRIPIYFTVNNVAQASTTFTECTTEINQLPAVDAAGPGAFGNAVNTRWVYQGIHGNTCNPCSVACDPNAQAMGQAGTPEQFEDLCDPRMLTRSMGCGFGNNSAWEWKCLTTDN